MTPKYSACLQIKAAAVVGKATTHSSKKASTTLLALPNLNKTKAQTIEPFLHLLPFNVFRLDGRILTVFPTLAIFQSPLTSDEKYPFLNA